MTRLLVHVEGQTEERFVNRVLCAHLVEKGYASVSARIVGRARSRNLRGGIKPWPAVKKDIVAHLEQDPSCVATTMVDYYGLPQSGGQGWPGRAEAAVLPGDTARGVELAVLADIVATMGPRFNPSRFAPFVVMHEFEGLLFSDCAGFSRALRREDLEPKFLNIRQQFSTPEDINDSPLTAPSKRVTELMPEYRKPIHGVDAALEIGLPKIRQECPHFNRWLTRLESL